MCLPRIAIVFCSTCIVFLFSGILAAQGPLKTFPLPEGYSLLTEKGGSLLPPEVASPFPGAWDDGAAQCFFVNMEDQSGVVHAFFYSPDGSVNGPKQVTGGASYFTGANEEGYAAVLVGDGKNFSKLLSISLYARYKKKRLSLV